MIFCDCDYQSAAARDNVSQKISALLLIFPYIIYGEESNTVAVVNDMSNDLIIKYDLLV